MVLLHKHFPANFHTEVLLKTQNHHKPLYFWNETKTYFFGLSKSSTIGVNFLCMNILGENILGLSILGVNILGPNNQNLWWFRSAVRGLQEHH